MAYFTSAARLIEYAMVDAGLLAEGSSPTGEQYTKNLHRLNDLVNLWQTQGLKLFLLQDVPVTLTAGVSQYTFGLTGTVVMNKPTRVPIAYFQDPNGVRRPLNPISWEEWTRLSQISASNGAINSFFVDKQSSLLKVNFWMAPDTTAALGTVHLVFQTQAPNFTSITMDSAFPQEWFIALRWGLADEICTGQPEAIMNRCQSRAMAYRTALEDWDVEDAPVRLEPDLHSYGGGSFR